MAPVIRIDDQVMDELKKRAVNKFVEDVLKQHANNKNVIEINKKRAVGLDLVFETPNATLRRVLGLGMDAKTLVDKIGEDALKQHANNKNVIEIKLNPSSRKYVYIPLPKDKRHFFPGYKVSFELTTDVGEFTAHVPYPPNAGGHIRGRFGPWYAKHPELKAGDSLRIEALEPGKRYKLSIVSQGV